MDAVQGRGRATAFATELRNASIELPRIDAERTRPRIEVLLRVARHLVHARSTGRVATAHADTVTSLLEVASGLCHLQGGESVAQAQRRLGIRRHHGRRRRLTGHECSHDDEFCLELDRQDDRPSRFPRAVVGGLGASDRGEDFAHPAIVALRRVATATTTPRRDPSRDRRGLYRVRPELFPIWLGEIPGTHSTRPPASSCLTRTARAGAGDRMVSAPGTPHPAARTGSP